MTAKPSSSRVTLNSLREMKANGQKFAMLTAYDYPTAAIAQRAGVHVVLTGDTLGCVILGHENTRNVPLDLIITLTEAVRRGAPDIVLMGDMPCGAIEADLDTFVTAARRFRDEAGCDTVKFEAGDDGDQRVGRLVKAGISTVAHLGLRPQQVTSPDGYRAQARDAHAVAELAEQARRMADAGADMILLEAVPNEASLAVVDAVSVPVIGCGAGAAVDGHVVVTHDMLGIGDVRPPRFVPVLAQVGKVIEDAMRRYVQDIQSGAYPGAQHVYGMKKASAGAAG
ncbi:MAG: 3-methyl-2-oxobutanoate hydroxymethyltransferase [Phycisphaerales bacterium]|nr:3-methyl-2-oxobutanoate hydroxymethyltransferase [Phycisphaerales bacterium]